jgi:2-succinyl-6-hydroxy-2,4-cyclohexadiene-1-carboxylate synthase
MDVVTRRVAVGDVELAIDEAGVGGRPLLLIHGFTGSRADFDMALGPLAEAGWHVVAPELRGHGDSSQPAEEAAYSFEIFATDVLGLADAVGFDRFTLLGHSMGGMIAQVAALRAPERIEALILMDTSHGRLTALDTSLLETIVEVARTQGMDVVADLMAEVPVLETDAYRRAIAADPTYAERGERQRRAASPAMFAAMILEIDGQADRLDRLAGLTTPTLVIVGEEDAPFLADSAAMAATIPGATLATIAGGGHSPQFEAHAGWWGALSGFLAGLPAREPAS